MAVFHEPRLLPGTTTLAACLEHRLPHDLGRTVTTCGDRQDLLVAMTISKLPAKAQ